MTYPPVPRTLDVVYILEIHSSLFTKELFNFRVEDLLPEGRLSQDLSLLKAPEEIQKNFKAFHYNIFPETKNFFLKNKCLPGYWYFMNGKDGMMIVHQHPVVIPDAVTGLLHEKSSRFLTSEN